MLNHLVNLIDALQYVNFLAVAILELVGVASFFLFRSALRIRRELFRGLLVLFLFFAGWRFLLEIPGRRYYVMTILASFPFALVPLMIDWKRVNWPRRWKQAVQVFFLIGILTVFGICIGRNLMPEKRSPVIAEFASAVRNSFQKVPAQGSLALIDNTTRGRQFLEEADLKWTFCWVPTYKEETNNSNAITHIQEYILPKDLLTQYDEIILFCRTAQQEELMKLIKEHFPEKGFQLLEYGSSKSLSVYHWARFQNVRKSKEEK